MLVRTNEMRKLAFSRVYVGGERQGGPGREARRGQDQGYFAVFSHKKNSSSIF